MNWCKVNPLTIQNNVLREFVNFLFVKLFFFAEKNEPRSHQNNGLYGFKVNVFNRKLLSYKILKTAEAQNNSNDTCKGASGKTFGQESTQGFTLILLLKKLMYQRVGNECIV